MNKRCKRCDAVGAPRNINRQPVCETCLAEFKLMQGRIQFEGWKIPPDKAWWNLPPF